MNYLDRREPMQGAVEPFTIDVKSSPRAGQPQREKYLKHLQWAHGLDYITIEEFHARMQAAAQAETTTQLQGLTRDLPSFPEPVPRASERFLRHNGRVQALGVTALITSVAIATLPTAAALSAPHPGSFRIGLAVFLVVLGIIGAVFTVAGMSEYEKNYKKKRQD